MRARLVGYSGSRPPVPGTEPVVPIDPNPDPPLDPDDPSIPDPLTLILEDGVPFHKLDYLAMGYNRFDVMCIGGSGGHSGTFLERIPDSATHSQTPPGDMDLRFDTYRLGFGGRGGGGGVHRIKGRLALLPTNVPVVVGSPGADGGDAFVDSPFHDWHSGGYPPRPVMGIGGDGETSSFGGVICRASGGKGGNDLVGGVGGIGNVELPGGGAAAGASGSWDGVIGSGGGGGNGSIIETTFPPSGDNHARGGEAGVGGSGSVSAADPLTKGPGGSQSPHSLDYTLLQSGSPPGYNYLVGAHYDAPHAHPGWGGGAKPFVINGETVQQYGSKADGRNGYGLVIVRLTYVIT